MVDRPTFPIGVNIFVVKDGKLLLGKRKGSAGEGMWGLPGGHLEYGESMPAAATRELMEETSLRATQFTFVNLVNDNANPARHYVQVGFLAEVAEGEVQLMEPEFCSAWEWFSLEALPENIFFGHAAQIELFRNEAMFGDTSVLS